MVGDDVMDCPNCRNAMASHEAERLYGIGTIPLDICHRCLAVWFDDKELLQLAPSATLQLVATLVQEDAGPRTPLSPSLACPRCRAPLVETHDRQRSTRFWYHRCPRGHGRLMTSYQFLRAKNFVRPLCEAEIAELREHVRQINCANCGAPVDIERDGICGFCRTPIAVLDPDQVRKVLEDQRQTAQAQQQKRADPTLPITLALERLRAERAWAGTPGSSRRPSVLDLFFGDLTDPIVGGLRVLARLLSGL